MRHIYKNKSGQVVTSEYAIVFFLVVAMLTAMTIYFRRAIQGRMYDARNYMIKEVQERTKDQYPGACSVKPDGSRVCEGGLQLYPEYEPYYVDTKSLVDRQSIMEDSLSEGGTSGLYRKSYKEDVTSVQTVSDTAPPREAK